MTTIVDRFSRFALFALISTSVPGCLFDMSESDKHSGVGGGGGSGGAIPTPEGPVAHDANEAWPKKSTTAPTITPEELVSACVEFTACGAGDPNATDPMISISYCVSQLIWSAERAIPASGLLKWNERIEHYVKCQLDHAGDCTAQKSCSSGRDSAIDCEEDGCRTSGGVKFAVTCDGSVAHLEGGTSTFDRDCALAYAECDVASPTGCTDRPFTACPPETSTKDRCDGNIRLGCDGKGQVSYHDCSRLGGVCGTTSDGSEGCIYKEPADAQCPDEKQLYPSCDGGTLSVCVNGARISVPGTGVCPSA
jgi:hypothetical protein